MQKALSNWTEKRGYRIVFGGRAVLNDVKAEIENRKDAGELDESLYRDYLADFPYGGGEENSDLKSVILIAMPRPAHRLLFDTQGGPLEAIVPPTYISYRQTADVIREEISALLGAGARLAPLNAPLKPLAAKLGLTKYGRNNIAYVPGIGSFHQLIGLLANLEMGSDYQALSYSGLPACENCRACLEACPTGAITEERFLLHAERCLTWHNEIAGDWPGWLPASAHHCLVGCLRCQLVCPQNQGGLRYESLDICFDARETDLILSSQCENDEGIKAKLTKIGLAGYAPVLGRNLEALLNR